MGLRRTNSTCNPERDYSYVEILEIAVGLDCCMMEDMAKNGSIETKRNLLRVLPQWGNTSDSIWEWQQMCLSYLLDTDCPRCDCHDGGITKDHDWKCENCGTLTPLKQMSEFEPGRVKQVAPDPDAQEIRAKITNTIEKYLGRGWTVGATFNVKRKKTTDSAKPYSLVGKLEFVPPPAEMREVEIFGEKKLIPKHKSGLISVYRRTCRSAKAATNAVMILQKELINATENS